MDENVVRHYRYLKYYLNKNYKIKIEYYVLIDYDLTYDEFREASLTSDIYKAYSYAIIMMNELSDYLNSAKK